MRLHVKIRRFVYDWGGKEDEEIEKEPPPDRDGIYIALTRPPGEAWWVVITRARTEKMTVRGGMFTSATYIAVVTISFFFTVD